MSDLTFGYVQDMIGLIWGAPVSVGNRAFAGTLRAGYGIIMNDVVGLAVPPMARIEASPLVMHAGTRIQDRGLRMAQVAGLTMPTADLSFNSVPLRISAPAETVRSIGNALGLQAAPAIINRSHDLLTRSELSCTKAEVLIPKSPLVIRTRQYLQAADAAIDRGDLDEASSAAEMAMQSASELEQQVAQAMAAEMAQARRAADQIARAGALWTSLHTHDGVHAWLARNARPALEQAVEQLRDARSRYGEGQFTDAEGLAGTVELNLSALIEQALSAIAVKQRDHMAVEAAQTLQQLGYHAQAAEVGDRQVVSASRDGKVMLTVSFDTDGRFEVDSRAGYKGSAKCSVAVNEILKALGEKMKLQVEGRTFVGNPDGDPGRSARTCESRRRLSIADMLSETDRPVTNSAYNQQSLMAAWATIAR